MNCLRVISRALLILVYETEHDKYKNFTEAFTSVGMSKLKVSP